MIKEKKIRPSKVYNRKIKNKNNKKKKNVIILKKIRVPRETKKIFFDNDNEIVNNYNPSRNSFFDY